MAKNVNIIFLDIDGVLNSEEYFVNNLDREGDNLFIDKKCVELLNSLAEKVPNLEIVISSSWGTSADAPLQNLGLKIPITGHTYHFHEDWLCRGNEIERYLIDRFKGMATKYGDKYREKEEYNYVILDDDEDMLLGQKYHFIQTSVYSGLTPEVIEKAVNILNDYEIED